MTFQDELVRFLRLLGKEPTSRRKWRALEIYCARCNDLAAEVFRAPTGPVPLLAVYRGLKTPNVEPGTIRPIGLQGKSIRDDYTHVLPLASGRQDGIELACRCGKHVIAAAAVIRAARCRQLRLVVAPRHADEDHRLSQ